MMIADPRAVASQALQLLGITQPQLITAAVAELARVGIRATEEALLDVRVWPAFTAFAARQDGLKEAATAAHEQPLTAVIARRVSVAALAYADAWVKLSRAMAAAKSQPS